MPRDVDNRLDEELRKTGMLLVVGEPGAGASRTAWELATRQTGNRRVLAAEPGQLGVAVDVIGVLDDPTVKSSYLVLWLDRIHKHPEITATLLRHCREGSQALRVIATIPSGQLEAWEAEHPALVEMPATSHGTSSTVFTKVPVAQWLSADEQARAAMTYPGLDTTWGIGASFTGLRSLFRREQAGDTKCPFEPAGGDCAVARALVYVACWWPSTGSTRPLTRRVLSDAVSRRLGPRGAVDDAHMEHALGWATDQVVEGISLLSHSTGPDGASVVAHSGLVDAVITRGDAEPVWLAALEDAHFAGETEEVGRIGYHAHRAGRFHIATTAWDMIPTFDAPGTHWIQDAADLSKRRHDARHAIAPLMRVLDLTESKHGPDHVEVARTLGSLGTTWMELGQPRKARELYEQALAILEREYGKDHVEVARTLNNLGSTWADSEPRKARELYEQALAIEEREYGEDHVDVVGTLNNLGRTWRETGEPRKARELYEQALAILEREYGPDHVKVARTRVGLGTTWMELGQPRKARELYEQALPIVKREYGPDHVEVASTLHNFGRTWMALGQLRKAREVYEQALAIKKREYGPDHVEVASTLHNLGTTWSGSGESRKARELYEQALAIKKREYGPDHVKVASTLVGLGTTWMEFGEPRKAREVYEQALAIKKREYGENHVEVASTLVHLGLCWQQLGDHARAQERWQRARRIYRAQDPPRPDAVARVERLLSESAPDIIPMDDGRTAVYPKPGRPEDSDPTPSTSEMEDDEQGPGEDDEQEPAERLV